MIPRDHDIRAFLSQSAVRQAHAVVSQVLHEGDMAVDATCGNGYDTAFLAQAVGCAGRVFAFDVQAEALVATKARLDDAGLSERVSLIDASHAEISLHLPASVRGHVQAVMFNLGYLPGGDHSITTEPSSTCAAIESGVRELRPGGVMTIVVYTGHEGGKAEAVAVEGTVRSLNGNSYSVDRLQRLNRGEDPPYLIVVTRRS